MKKLFPLFIWLYADQLIKQEERIMFRPPTHGGLGVHSVRWKALAGLIRSFLETACNPKFQTSQYHSMLFRYHVLQDQSVPEQGYPPFYNIAFFDTIRRALTDYELKVSTMTEKEWYMHLLQCHCTMEEDEQGHQGYIQCNAELKHPASDWVGCWRRARLPGLGPENTSFLFRMMHNTLVTQERLSRTSPTVSPCCKFPGCGGTDDEDLQHALVHCHGNDDVGNAIFNVIRSHAPGITVDDAVRLEFNVDESVELPLVWFTAVAWSNLWDLRMNKTRPSLYLVRAELEVKISFLRKCRRQMQSH